MRYINLLTYLLTYNPLKGSGPSTRLSLHLNLVSSLFISKTSSIHVQWIPAHIGITGNTLADLEAKQASTLPQTSVPIDLVMAKVLIRRTSQKEFHACIPLLT